MGSAAMLTSLTSQPAQHVTAVMSASVGLTTTIVQPAAAGRGKRVTADAVYFTVDRVLDYSGA